MIGELTTAAGIAALAAAILALCALALGLVLAARVRRLRRAQTVVLGDGGRDLVEHSQRIEQGFGDLRSWVEEVLTRLDGRMEGAEGRIDGCITHRALVRYDAYGEMSGRQSSSVALLDARRSGVVISSILHRDQARVYVKQIQDGTSELDLSPEELEAIEVALTRSPG